MCQWPERTAAYESYLQAGPVRECSGPTRLSSRSAQEISSGGKCLGTVGIMAAPRAALRVHWPTFLARMESFWFRMCPERVQGRSLASPGDAQVHSGKGRKGVRLDLFAWPRGPKLPNIGKTFKNVKKRLKNIKKR